MIREYMISRPVFVTFKEGANLQELFTVCRVVKVRDLAINMK